MRASVAWNKAVRAIPPMRVSKELRAEICRYLARRMELNYQPSEVLVTVGGSEAH